MALVSTRSRIACLALALLAVASCGDQESPLSPQQQPSYAKVTTDLRASDVSLIARYKAGPPNLLFAMAWKWIGPAGGSLELFGFEIVVPPGAVTRSTRFMIKLPVENPNQADFVLAEFGPHNQTFLVPLTIRVPHTGTTAEGNPESHILWWTGNAWQPYPTILRPDGRVETQTTHFSEWGLERGITMAGG